MRNRLSEAVMLLLFLALALSSVQLFAQGTSTSTIHYQVPIDSKQSPKSEVALTFDIDGETVDIYQSSRGTYFLVRISEDSGKPYKTYLGAMSDSKTSFGAPIFINSRGTKSYVAISPKKRLPYRKILK